MILLGDSKLVFTHVKNKYQVKKCKLQAYLRRVEKLLESFSTFNIMFICRDRNPHADYLAASASLFNQNNIYVANPFKVGILYKPAVPDKLIKRSFGKSLKVMNKSQNF